MVEKGETLVARISACRICADRFAATATAHAPRPVAWFRPSARILIAGQAPGMRVHLAGEPFRDPSGDRLRAWTGLDEATFYDRDLVAIVPMAFCFPGYDAKGADLPPPPICAATWHSEVMATLSNLRLVLLVGGAAQKWHLGVRASVTEVVGGWRNAPKLGSAEVWPLPHPSWRTRAWAARSPWFEAELLPALRARIADILKESP